MIRGCNMDDIVGTIVGIYKVQYLCDFKSNDGHKMYHVECVKCGFETDMRKSDIKIPRQCKHQSITGLHIDFKSHFTNKRIRSIFSGMKERCYDTNNKNYNQYGAKGICICEEWLRTPNTFEQWALANGYADDLTIDRIDSGGNYTSDNCRWLPIEENARRAGKVNWIEIDGVILTGRQWAEKLQLGINIINTAIREHGLDKTTELIRAMLKELPSTKHRKPHQTWFSAYSIQT